MRPGSLPPQPSDSRRGGGRRRLAHGDLPLLLLSLIAGQPRHGYELIQLIADTFHGHYTPSAGTVYPALAQLVEAGHINATEDGSRKRYALTEAGREFMRAQAELMQQMQARTSHSARMVLKASVPPAVRDGMEQIKQALGTRLGRWDQASIAHAVQALRRAAREIDAGPAQPHDSLD
ncbi:PadR family transcriptional regulator [Pseudoxanthomonas composti]|uniref:PadR family transcriptional regulator n=1 Tax=Pseudoxanthomonas composti TaxID=2137479 RepID=A0A4Q1JWK9_9GAMM|nr:PadR family transcriptional regulator [Pseudoxanthomonas composti]RXR06555.1 PadR family transcriptional regulator [Pseudoxanthomonas composti]